MDHQPEQRCRRHGQPVQPSAVERTPIPGAAERIEEVRRLCADPTTPPWRIDEAYVEAIRPELVTKSQEFYGREGRGIILIDFGAGDLRHMAADDVIPCFYVSEAVRQQRGFWWPEELRRLVRDYDPVHEVIIVVHHDTSPPVFRRMRVDQSASEFGQTYVWHHATHPRGMS